MNGTTRILCTMPRALLQFILFDLGLEKALVRRVSMLMAVSPASAVLLNSLCGSESAAGLSERGPHNTSRCASLLMFVTVEEQTVFCISPKRSAVTGCSGARCAS